MRSMKFGVIVFPGSNCDHDCYHAVKHVFGQGAEYVWHKERSLKGFDCIILPGGFSYGDYLRTGAIARLSPVMEEVIAFAKRGGPVLGICNGFQILTEVGLLPGLLMMNGGPQVHMQRRLAEGGEQSDHLYKCIQRGGGREDTNCPCRRKLLRR